MSSFVPAGAVTSALTHFALYGLAAICEDETGSPATLLWTDEALPRPQLDIGYEPAEIAAMVHRHASRCASPGSWLSVRVENDGKDTAAFSPRIATPSTPLAWRQLQGARWAGLDVVISDAGGLDLRMIGALGEQAYWLTGEPADKGASRWEMKTRQGRGGEFVGGRLIKLAHAVAARTVDGVLCGLTGQSINDEVGENKADSRSGTGLTRPGPVDNALAWCALWGISQFPVVHHNAAQSGTAGTYVPARRAYPDFVFLPVPTRPITTARLRTILASRQLAQAAKATDTSDPLDVIATQAARQWLTGRSIRVLMIFRVAVSDNANAPERQILDGSVFALTRPSEPWN
jgi:CRISPR-associated protein Csb3